MTFTADALFANLFCAVFVSTMVYVIVTDLRWRLIPNWSVLMLLATYPLGVIALSMEAGFALGGLMAAAVMFLLCFFAFGRGWIGGGDAKLIPVIALWLGAGLTLPFLLYATALGGILTMIFLVATRPKADSQQPLVVPYGPALAIAALILFPSSDWAGALP